MAMSGSNGKDSPPFGRAAVRLGLGAGAAGFGIWVLGALLFSSVGGSNAESPFTETVRVLDGVVELDGSQHANSLAALQSGAVVLLSATTLEPTYTYYPERGRPTSIAISPVENVIAIGTSFGDVVLLNATTGEVLRTRGEAIADGNWARALLWSPTGTMLAADFANGTLQVLSPELALLGSFSKPVEGPMAWVLQNSSEHLLFGFDAARLTIQSIVGGAEVFSSSFVPHRSGEWAMWPNGSGLTLLPGGSSRTVFVTDDYGRSLGASTILLEPLQDRIRPNLFTGEVVSYGSRINTVTAWSAELVPYLMADLGAPVEAAAWVSFQTLVAWTSGAPGTLHLIHFLSSAPALSITIDSPPPGSTQSGEMIVTGGITPFDRSGTVFLKIDRNPWYRTSAEREWRVTADTRDLADGNHRIWAVFSDGATYSAPAEITVHVTNGLSTDALSSQMWFVAPQSNQTVTGVVRVTIGTWNPNRQDGSVDFVEFSVDRGIWQRMGRDGISRSGEFDSTAMPNGVTPIYGRSFDGRSYSEVGWILVRVANELPPPQLGVVILLPEDGSLLSGRVNVTGTLTWGGSESPRLELSIDGGTWAEIPTPMAPNWSYAFSADAASARWLSVCARARTVATTSQPVCRNYATLGLALNEAPSVSIQVAHGNIDAAGTMHVTAGGIARDDVSVSAVYVRMDGGPWSLVTGSANWSALISARVSGPGPHVLEAVAFDGFVFGRVQERTVELIDERNATAAQPGENGAQSGTAGSSGPVLLIPLAGALLVAAGLLVRARRNSDLRREKNP